MYIKARQWIRETFVRKSRPRLADVAEWVEDGEIHGRWIGGELYIDESRPPQVSRRPPKDGIDLLD